MELSISNLQLNLFLILTSALFLLYIYVSRRYNYFRSRGVPYLKPFPLLGTLWLFTKSQAEQAKAFYNSFPEEKFFGFFQGLEPTYVIRDPELLQKVLIKDFVHFHDRGFPVSEKDVLASKNLFFLNGNPWRFLRHKLTPTFTTGKMKLMFDQLMKSGENLLNNLDDETPMKALDSQQIFMNYASEVIASTAFGIDFSKNNPQSKEFVKKASNGFHDGFRLAFVMFIITNMPKLADIAGISFFKPGVKDYFTNLTKATKEYRKNNNIKRNDYFDLLMKLQEGKVEENDKSVLSAQTEEDSVINQMKYASTDDSHNKLELKSVLTDEVMAAQSFIFLMAGSDNIANTVSFAFYHIARDISVQKRLAEEVDQCLAKHGGWTYQGVKEMTFLEQVIQETLRLLPQVPFLNRKCTSPYRIPGTDIVLEKEVKLYIPISGLHLDPKLYPDPETFNPDRFAHNSFIKPSPIYLPFGDGPRICIGMRFAVLEMKICMAKILSKYTVELDKKTQVPLVFDTKAFSPKPVGGIWINLKRRK